MKAKLSQILSSSNPLMKQKNTFHKGVDHLKIPKLCLKYKIKLSHMISIEY